MTGESAAPGYDIEFDAAAGILMVRLHGFWTLATFAAFSAKVLATATAARLRHGAFDVLSDLSDFPVQSQTITAAFSTFLKTSATVKFGRMATVYSSALNRMQAQREAPFESARYFDNREDALRWLREGKA